MSNILTFQFLLCFSCSVCFGQGEAKNKQFIVLKDEKLAVEPKEFYVERLIDNRENKEAVAWLIPPFIKKGHPPKTLTIDLKNGGFKAIKQFNEYALPKNKNYHPLEIVLTKFKAQETITGIGQIKGQVDLGFSFNIITEFGESRHLSDYSSSSTYYRNPENQIDVEPILRHMLEKGLIYIDNLINKEVGSNILLAKKTAIKFTDYFDKVEGDTIYYSTNRPLKWDDFQSKTAVSKFEAVVFASFGYNEQVIFKDGVIRIVLEMKVYVPKSACWVKNGSSTPYALNHEQRHFDIAKIVAERYKQKLSNVILPVNNYDGIINVNYFDSLSELNNLEKQYDDETAHGINNTIQNEWDIKIDSWLHEVNIK